MSPILPYWDPKENDQSPYASVHVHSPGMISIVYEPPSQEAADEIRAEVETTEAFRLLERFRSNGGATTDSER